LVPIIKIAVFVRINDDVPFAIQAQSGARKGIKHWGSGVERKRQDAEKSNALKCKQT
jgi:hypothetical protein